LAYESVCTHTIWYLREFAASLRHIEVDLAARELRTQGIKIKLLDQLKIDLRNGIVFRQVAKIVRNDELPARF